MPFLGPQKEPFGDHHKTLAEGWLILWTWTHETQHSAGVMSWWMTEDVRQSYNKRPMPPRPLHLSLALALRLIG